MKDRKNIGILSSREALRFVRISKSNESENTVTLILTLLILCIVYMIRHMNDTTKIQLEEFYGVTKEDVAWSNTICTVVNLLWPLIAGILVDMMGAKMEIFACTVITFSAQFLITFSSIPLFNQNPNYALFLLGRFLVGIGQGGLNAGFLTILSKIFAKNNLATAIGFYLFVDVIARFLPLFLMPVILQNGKNYAPFIGSNVVGLVICAIAILISIILLLRNDSSQTSQYGADRIQTAYYTEWSFLLEWRFYIFVGLNCFFFAGQVATAGLLTPYFIEVYSMTVASAGMVIPITLGSAAILSPFMGILVDNVKQNAFFILIGCISLCISLLLFAFTANMVFAIIGLVLFAISAGTYYSAWVASCPSFIQSPELGRANGVFKTIENWVIMLVVFSTSQIKNNATQNSFLIIFLFMGILAFLCVILGIVNLAAWGDNKKKMSIPMSVPNSENIRLFGYFSKDKNNLY